MAVVAASFVRLASSSADGERQHPDRQRLAPLLILALP
jgi:hypothetical protein